MENQLGLISGDPWATWVLRGTAALGRASLEGGALILAVWLLCRLFPRLPASLRAGLWWIACLRLLVGLASLAGLPPLRLALLPPAPAVAMSPIPPVPPASSTVLPAANLPVSPAPILPLGGPQVSGSLSPARPILVSLPTLGWRLLLGLLWLGAVVAQLAFALAGLVRLRATLRRARPLSSGPAAELCAELEEILGLPHARAWASLEVGSPQVVGLFAPRILLPEARLAQLSRGELAMVLCHELFHLRRGDLWLGWVPALAERLFFFHPLAGLAAREYALAREAACDAEVLRLLGEPPQAYGRLLLKLGVERRTLLAAAATAPPRKSHLKRRLQMLEHTQQKRRFRILGWGLLALAAVALVPFRIVAAERSASAAVKSAEPSARAALAVQSATPPVPPTPSKAPVPPKPPRPARAAKHASMHHDGPEFVLLTEKGSTMSGSTEDIERAKKLLGPGEREILWFRQDGKEFVVRDRSTIEAVKALYAPQAELGNRQAELGHRQAELGSHQAELGSRQAALGSEQAKLGAEQARLAGEQAGLSMEGKEANALAAKEDELGRKQDELGKKQDELGRQQDELGKQQDELGRKQDLLGQEQDKLAREADEKLKGLIARTVSEKIAKEVGQ